MSKPEKQLTEDRRKEIRRRFRNLIRSVAINRAWLAEGDDDKKITMNVKRNIAMLVRTQRKLGVLTMAEKGLIRTIHELRSVEDRKHLVKLLTNLKCFSRLPPKVIARLVPVIKFMYLRPNRVIIREGDLPDSLYFILYGEVEVSMRIYDRFSNKYSEKLVFIYGPGDSIGEVELIEGGRRRYTFTTSNDVELLVVYGADFERVLKPVMTQQWQQRKQALNSVGYFKWFTRNQLISACKMSFLKEFSALDTIYFEDEGQLSYVHFILSGECMILQCLKLKVFKYKDGRKRYKLAELPKDGKNTIVSDEYTTRDDILKAIRASFVENARKSFDIDEELESEEDEDSELVKIKRALRMMDLDTIQAACKQRHLAEVRARREAAAAAANARGGLERKSIRIKRATLLPPPITSSADSSEETIYEGEFEYEKYENRFRDLESSVSGISEYDSQIENRVNSFGLHFDFDKKPQEEAEPKVEPQPKESEQKEDTLPSISSKLQNLNEETVLSGGSKEGKSSRHSKSTVSSNESDYTIKDTPSSTKFSDKGSVSYENHFIDVGTLSAGGIFGLGEQLEHRVIVARTKVQCLTIPRFWLFESEQNLGNIWQRRRHVLDTHIPSREALFQNFLDTIKWNKFKKDYIGSILDANSVSNPTKIQDIPIMLYVMGGDDSNN